MSLPYFRWWVENWLASPNVKLMSFEQRGIYQHMLCVSWQMGPLPDNAEEIATLIGCDQETFKKAWDKRLKNRWKKTKKGLINCRLENERKWAKKRSELARKAVSARPDRRNGNYGRSTRVKPAIYDLSYNDPDPDPDPDPDIYKREKKKKRSAPHSPTYPIYWNTEHEEFHGTDCQLCKERNWEVHHENCGLQKLKNAIRKRYGDEFGTNWMNAIWTAIHDWVGTKLEGDPEFLAKKYKDLGLFILGWYRRQATEERKK